MDFRDLNGNGRLDPYEDPRRPVEERVEDLLGRLTLAEKAGLLFHAPIGVGRDLARSDPPFGGPTAVELVAGKHITHLNVYVLPSKDDTIDWHNRLQKLGESTRLGIPVTVSSDPRHSHADNLTSGIGGVGLSAWPESLGFAAADDEELVRSFGDIARREYRALGLHVALHPMADLFTEPRWARGIGTFGESAELASRLVRAYIEGFQGAELGPESVACMTKHFPGGGPQLNGEDAHFPYGREQVYPGGRFDYHLIPFEAALAAGTAQIMPYYGMPVGAGVEEVGFGFNRDVITTLLRERYAFAGVVCTDWGLLTDDELFGTFWPARAWGVEHLDTADRALKALAAGIDQFGGETCPELLVGLVEAGRLSEERLDESARRILRDKFRLGLFDNPYLDPAASRAVVGNPEFRQEGETAQRRAMVLLVNRDDSLPLAPGARVYVEGIDPGVAGEYASVASEPGAADFAIVRVGAPFEPRDAIFIETLFHQGDLDFKGAERERILALLDRVPTVIVIHLDRPAVIPEIAARCAGLLAEFGASDRAVLDVVFGRFTPTGRLPVEVPSSMDAVRAQLEDVPHDSSDPLFAFGHGLTYAG